MNFKAMKKTQYFFIYTLLFSFLCFFFLRPFFLQKISFVWNVDGWNQHIKAYIYYSQWLKNIFHTLLFENKFVIPQWDFNMGFGADIISTMNYYVLGEPLTVLCLFVKAKNMPVFYSFLIILRLYLAGLSFSYFCFYQKLENRLGIFIGSMIYVFSAYPLVFGLHHPFFLIPMIMLPLWCVGFEKIKKNESPVLFILSVFISLVSNFYFFYMTFLLFAFYFLFRLESWKEAKALSLKTVWYGLIGTMMGCVIFLPVLYLFSLGARDNVERHYPLFYGQDFFGSLFLHFDELSGIPNHTSLGFPFLILFFIVLFLCMKKQYKTKIAFVLFTVFLCSPWIGHIFNGFSYNSNRWSFGYSFLLCYIVALVFHSYLNKEKRGYLAKSIIAIGLVIITLLQMNNMICEYYIEKDKVSEYMTSNEINTEIKNAPDTLFKKHKGWYRYSSVNSLTKRNNNILYNVPSTNFYWSLNDGIFDYSFRTLGIPSSSYNYKNLNGRSVLNSLSCVRYFVTPKNKSIALALPKGCVLYKETKDYYIYRNPYSLPFGYTYDKKISYSDFVCLSPVAKENALMYGVVSKDALPLEKTKYSKTVKNIPYYFIPSPTIKQHKKQYVVTKEDDEIILHFNGLHNCETYFTADIEYQRLDGKLVMEPVSVGIQAKSKKKTVSNHFMLFCKNSVRYNGNDHFVVNTGLKKKNKIILKFHNTGIYTIKNVKVLCQPLTHYEQTINKRQTLKHLVFQENGFYGSINVPNKQCLVIPTAYSKGWTATIDGKPVDIHQVQLLYNGIIVPKGKHIIQFKYETPNLRLGLFFTVLGQILFLGVILRRCYYGKNVYRHSRL